MRPPRFVRRLTSKEQQAIDEMFREGPNHRARMRANAIRLSARGWTVGEIAEASSMSAQTVRDVMDRFESDGVDALVDRPRPGRPPVVTPEFRERLAELLRRTPADIDRPEGEWTLGLLREVLEWETGIVISITRIRQIISEDGLDYRPPKYQGEVNRMMRALVAAYHALPEISTRTLREVWGSCRRNMRNSWQTEQLLMATCGIARIVHGPVETPEDTGAEKESTDAVA